MDYSFKMTPMLWNLNKSHMLNDVLEVEKETIAFTLEVKDKVYEPKIVHLRASKSIFQTVKVLKICCLQQPN